MHTSTASHSANDQSAVPAQEHTTLLSDDSSTWQAGSVGAKRPLSPQQLLSMTVLLAGIQFVWTVELGYGTPYLLSLGLSKPLMTLVWMAGPLSGLLIQPVVGSLSDRCFSKLGRRRPFIVGGAAFVVASVIAIAYAKEMAQFLAQLKGISGSTEPGSDYQLFVTRTAIVLAVIGFYVLDFSINTSQACARALALDIPPLHQQDLANAYAGRMLNLGSVSGYMVGFMDLRALLPWKTDSQMQALCLIAIVVFVATITWTCVSVREVPLIAKAEEEEEEEDGERLEEDQPSGTTQRPRQGGLMSEWSAMFTSIAQGIVRLPTPVQRVCNVQFFAWVAWFPFLFFATTWVTEVMARTAVDASDPDFVERATRAGSFALFLYSIASLAFSMVLPMFVKDEALSSSAKVSLRTMWRLSLVAMCATLLLTHFVADVRGATALIIAMAFPWSLAMWAPFALVGEYVSIAADGLDDSRQETADDSRQETANDDAEEEDEGVAGSSARYGACDNDSDSEMLLGRSVCDSQPADELVVGSQSTAVPLWKRQHELAAMHRSGAVVRGDSIGSTIGVDDSPLPPNSKTNILNKRPGRIGEEGGGQPETVEHHQMRGAEKLESGAILGIHNMYVVLPQFVINAVSSLVFAWLGESSDAGKGGAIRSVEFMAMDAAYSVLGGGGSPAAGEAVGTVLRIGGASALVAAALTLFLFDRRRVREYVASQR